MNLNLDTLKSEILECLGNEGFVIFHGYSRLAETDSFVAWDSDRYPDYRQFLKAAQQAGIKMIVFNDRQFSAGHLEDAAERLQACDLAAEERRTLERRLRELRAFEGFTCALELSFDCQGRVYLLNLRAEWYEDFLDLLEELDAFLPEDEEEGDSMGGYFSRN
jgi:hypothetical protein